MEDVPETRATVKLELSAEALLQAARRKLKDALLRLGTEAESKLEDERITDAGALASEAGELLGSLVIFRIGERSAQGDREG